jgi:HlyD family secretion protein
MSMDVPRPVTNRRRRRRLALLLGGAGAMALIPAVVAAALARARPAAPSAERASLSIDMVRRQAMLRQARGTGTLVPEELRWVTAGSAGQVERIPFLPGVAVTADTVVVELSNPELAHAVVELESDGRAAAARRERLRLQLESDRLAQEALLASLRSERELTAIEADGDQQLAAKGYGPALVARRSRAKAEQLATRIAIEEQRLEAQSRSGRAQLAAEDAAIAKLRAQESLRRTELDGLSVRAGIDGVLQRLGDEQPLRVGQHVAAGAPLARIADPSRLKAELRVAEVEAKDVALGQAAVVDTRNGVAAARVVRIDPAVQNGTVTVDLAWSGRPPPGARPDLAVDGTITLERLDGVLCVGRPIGVGSDEGAAVRVFKLLPGGRAAVRVPVRFGRRSFDRIEVVDGLAAGDQIVVSDLSRFDGNDRLLLD